MGRSTSSTLSMAEDRKFVRQEISTHFASQTLIANTRPGTKTMDHGITTKADGAMAQSKLRHFD